MKRLDKLENVYLFSTCSSTLLRRECMQFSWQDPTKDVEIFEERGELASESFRLTNEKLLRAPERHFVHFLRKLDKYLRIFYAAIRSCIKLKILERFNGRETSIMSLHALDFNSETSCIVQWQEMAWKICLTLWSERSQWFIVINCAKLSEIH